MDALFLAGLPPITVTEAKSNPQQDRSPGEPPENLWINLACNIAVPALILMKAESWMRLTPASGLVIALAFPVIYFIYDLATRQKVNVLSILGFMSVLVTGGIGLLHLDKELIAVKEAAVPAVIGIAVIVSLKTPYPLVRTFLFSDQIINVPLVERRLRERGNESEFEGLLQHCTLLLAVSFLLSSILNYGLARFIITADTGTAAFNEQLGRLTLWSWPVIVIPCMFVSGWALYKLIKGSEHLTGLTFEEIFHAESRAPSAVDPEGQDET